MLTSARLFFRGPVWVALGGVSALATLVGILSGCFWVWLSIGLALLVVASFVTFDRERQRAVDRAASLPARIDELHRVGIALLDELSKPLDPPSPEDPTTWQIPLGSPPGWFNKAEEFDQKVRDLLVETYPALLSDYAKGFNAHRRLVREREEARASDPEKDNRSNAVKSRSSQDTYTCAPRELWKLASRVLRRPDFEFDTYANMRSWAPPEHRTRNFDELSIAGSYLRLNQPQGNADSFRFEIRLALSS